jgi:hypothetical protein
VPIPSATSSRTSASVMPVTVTSDR